MPRGRGKSLPKAYREDLKERVWQMSKDGMSVQAIARRAEIDVHLDTVQTLLNERYAENHELRKTSGVAEQDLLQYIAAMDDDRIRALNQYRKALKRLEDEEDLEIEHAKVREDKDGSPPTTAITRALEFHMRGMPAATKALDSARQATEAKGRVLGLEAAGKEEAKLQLNAKRSELIGILNTPVTIEIKIAPPPPEGWDSAEDDD